MHAGPARPTSRLSRLSHLDLSGNSITDFGREPKALKALNALARVGALKNLRTLNLARNSLADCFTVNFRDITRKFCKDTGEEQVGDFAASEFVEHSTFMMNGMEGTVVTEPDK